MDDFSSFLPNVAGKALVVKDELPKIDSGQTQGSTPTFMGVVDAKLGIQKDVTRLNSYDFRITARMRYTLRKRHAYIAAVHKAIIRQACKAEICVEPIDPSKPYNENTKAEMEQFARDGFGEFGEKRFRGYLLDTKKWNGDAWAEIVFETDADGKPIFVQKLIAETMRILPNESGQVIGYPQVVDGALNFTFSPQNIIHLKENDDEYSFFGYSDLDALYSALLLDILADENMQAKLENDSSPGGILDVEQTDDAELLRLRWLIVQQLRQAPGKPILLNGIKQWIPPQFGTKDMDWNELHHHVKEKVLMVYGVLPMQVAVVETGKLANPDQQIEIGEEYIRQELEAIQEPYNLKLTPFFKDSANLMFKFGDVQPKLDALQKEAAILKTKADAAKVLSTIPGAYTIDEIRKITDHEELENGTGGEYVQQAPAPSFGQPPEQEEQELPKDASFENKALMQHKATRAENREKFARALNSAYAKFTRETIKDAKANYDPPQKDENIKAKSIQSFIGSMGGQIATLATALDAISKASATKSYKDAKVALGASFGKPDARAVESLLLTGGTLEAIKGFTLAQREGFSQVLRESFDKGLDLRNMVKEMRNFAETETYKLERIARTESNRFANQGRFSGYNELEKKRGTEYLYDWVGPNDERTTEICTDIKTENPYSLEEIQTATDGGEPHINCRHNCVRHFD